MGARENALTSDIERTRAAVAEDLAALKREADELKRKLAMAAGAAVAAIVVYRVIRFLVRRSKD